MESSKMMGCIRLILVASLVCCADGVDQYEFVGVKGFSNCSVQMNALSQKMSLNSFYTFGNPVSTKLFIEDGKLLASYNTLIQMPLLMGANWSSKPNSSTIPIHVIMNLIDGEVGIDFARSSIGLVNSFHLYFTRVPYHLSGLVFRYKYPAFGEYSVSILEQDRMNGSRPTLIFQVGFEHG